MNKKPEGREPESKPEKSDLLKAIESRIQEDRERWLLEQPAPPSKM